MEYWLAHKNGRVIEQVLCEEGQEPIWSTESASAIKARIDRHGDLLAEIFDPASSSWSASSEYAVQSLKRERNRRLVESDFPPLFERPAAQQPAWKAYRQALRDLPATNPDPFNPEWPIPPIF